MPKAKRRRLAIAWREAQPAIKEPAGWWITCSIPGFGDHGSYPTKREAHDDRRGLQRFITKNRL